MYSRSRSVQASARGVGLLGQCLPERLPGGGAEQRGAALQQVSISFRFRTRRGLPRFPTAYPHVDW